jgi:hypothetical protein
MADFTPYLTTFHGVNTPRRCAVALESYGCPECLAIKLRMITTTAMTRRMWINPPAMRKINPSNQQATSTPAINSSMSNLLQLLNNKVAS